MNTTTAPTTDPHPSASEAAVPEGRPPLPPGLTGPAVARSLMRMRRSPLDEFDHLADTFGDVARLTMRGGLNSVFLRGPDAVRHVLVTNQDNYGKSVQYQLLQRIVGLGLITSEGELWQRRRALIQPMFAKRHLGPFADHMAVAASAALDDWEASWADGERVDLSEQMSALTLDVVGRALVGTDFTARSGAFGEALVLALKAFGEMGRSPVTQLGGAIDWIGVPNAMRAQPARLRRMDRGVDVLDDIVLGVIDRRLAENGREPAGGDLLTLLLDARDPDTGAPLDRVQLRDELMTFVTAGHETTANALVWMWYLLSRNPAARDQLLAEVDEVLGGRVARATDLDALPWTMACFHETMRLYPPAWHVQRIALEDDVVGGFHIAKGTQVFVSTWATHRDPNLWENPAGFDPRRFLGDAPKQRPRHAYLPFGGGRRVCIGQGFATLEAGILAAMIAQRFTFDVVPSARIVLEPTATLRPQFGMPVTAHRRLAPR